MSRVVRREEVDARDVMKLEIFKLILLSSELGAETASTRVRLLSKIIIRN